MPPPRCVCSTARWSRSGASVKEVKKCNAKGRIWLVKAASLTAIRFGPRERNKTSGECAMAEVGLIQIMPSFGYPGVSDQEVYEHETRLAVLADELGYDHVWVVEHHFEDYSFCPDTFVYLAHLAGLTKRIRLATGAVIVPWNIQPLRVAEKAALLDTLSGGRAILGIGRGLSRREFDQFGIKMDESRDRFDEAAPMILDALESGVMEEHHGKYFDQPRATIRPKPASSFRGRTAQVAMSPDSALEAAKLGVQMMAFNYKPLPV